MNARSPHELNARSSEQALAAFGSKKAEIDAMLSSLQDTSKNPFFGPIEA